MSATFSLHDSDALVVVTTVTDANCLYIQVNDSFSFMFFNSKIKEMRDILNNWYLEFGEPPPPAPEEMTDEQAQIYMEQEEMWEEEEYFGSLTKEEFAQVRIAGLKEDEA